MKRVVPTLKTATLLLAAPLALMAQEPREYTISGAVFGDAADQPLAGVQVSIPETTLGTLTNDAGRYTLRATLPPGDYTLNFSFIGRRTASVSVTLGEQTTVTLQPVVLQASAVQLEEIVVTGTGVPTQKRAIGNTVATVSGRDVNDAPGAGAVDVALQGKVTGATISQNSGQPGGGVSIRLRGTSSILGGAEPLIVIDGVIVDNSSAAMISLGANAGRGNAALTNRLSDISPSDIERIEVIKGAAAAALYGSKANSGVIQIFTRRGQQGAPRIRVTTEVSASRTPDTYDLMMHPEGTLADVIWGTAAFVGDTVERFDYQDEIFRTGMGNRTHISVAGGTEGTTYYLAGGRNVEQGIVRGSDYRRIDARASVGQQVTGWLDVMASGQVIDTDGQFVPEGEQTQGVLTSVIFTPTSWNPFFNEELGRFPYNPILGNNPFDVIQNWDASDDVTRFVGSLEATVRPTDDVTLKYLLGYDDYRQENRYFQPPLARPNFTGEINNPVRFSRQMNHDVTANHEAELSDRLHLTTTAGTRYTEDRSEVISSTARNLPPGQELVGGATLVTGQSLVEIRTFGAFLQERVSLNDRLYVTGGFNYEGASAFGEDERWQLFPRASVSYLLHEEPAFTNAAGDLISTLRLRAAYGETGGQPPGAFDRFANFFDIGFAGRPGLVASTLAPNPNLKPERQREVEAGFEVGVWNDRALLDFTYYTQTTSDLVLSVPLRPSSGFQSRRENIGELTNRGVELALSTVNVSRPGFNWRSRLQLAANRNEVTRLVTNADTLVFGYLNAVMEGQPVGVFYGGVYARNPDGSLATDANDIPFRARDTINVAMCDLANNVTEGCPFAARVVGDPNPDWTASLSNQLQIGDDLSFSFLLDGRFGNDVANFTRRITEFFGADANVEKERTGEVPERFFALNPNGRIQVYEEYIEDGSFVKLREVALSYQFDQPWVQRLGAESMRLRLSGRDLWTWTRYSGLDPEINLFSANTVARGVDFATTPVPRTFLLGLDFTF